MGRGLGLGVALNPRGIVDFRGRIGEDGDFVARENDIVNLTSNTKRVCQKLVTALIWNAVPPLTHAIVKHKLHSLIHQERNYRHIITLHSDGVQYTNTCLGFSLHEHVTLCGRK